MNPKITKHFETYNVDIVGTDETVIESYDESNIHTKKNDEYVSDIVTENFYYHQLLMTNTFNMMMMITNPLQMKKYHIIK